MDERGSPRENKVLVVVRLGDDVENLCERLKWIEDVLFKDVSPFKQWLILIGSTPDEMVPGWRYYPKWEALYGFLLDDGFFEHFYDKKRKFDFGLYLNLRRNHHPGLGWGMEECYNERCITRAMFLAADGNVLFGDWGYPDACHPDTTFEKLRNTMDLPAYMYIKVLRRRYPKRTKYMNRPFVLLLDHYLKPTEAEKTALLEENIARVQKGVNKILFTPEQLRYALWNARFQMYFASDGFQLVHHRWKYFPELQFAVVLNYMRLRGWSVNSTWLEIGLDLSLIFMASSVFTTVSGFIQQQEGFREFIWLEVKYILWIVFWETFFIQRNHCPEDRLTARQFGRFLIQYVCANAFVENVRFFVMYALQDMIQDRVPLLAAGWIFISSSDALLGYLLWDDRYRNPLTIAWQGLCLSLVSLAVTWHDIEKMARLGMIVNGLAIPFFAFMVVPPLRTTFLRTRRFNYRLDWELLRSVWVVPLVTSTLVTVSCLPFADNKTKRIVVLSLTASFHIVVILGLCINGRRIASMLLALIQTISLRISRLRYQTGEDPVATTKALPHRLSTWLDFVSSPPDAKFNQSFGESLFNDQRTVWLAAYVVAVHAVCTMMLMFADYNTMEASVYSLISIITLASLLLWLSRRF